MPRGISKGFELPFVSAGQATTLVAPLPGLFVPPPLEFPEPEFPFMFGPRLIQPPLIPRKDIYPDRPMTLREMLLNVPVQFGAELEKPIVGAMELGARIGAKVPGIKKSSKELLEMLKQPEKYGLFMPKAAEFKTRIRREAYATSNFRGTLQDAADMGFKAEMLMFQWYLLGGLGIKVPPGYLGRGSINRELGKRIARIGTRAFLATPGDFKQRLSATTQQIGYNVTPYVIGSLGLGKGSSVLGDTGLNVFLSSPTYARQLKEAGGINEDFLSVAAPQAMMDLAFALQTRAIPEVAWPRMRDRYYGKRAKEMGLPKAEYVRLMDKIRVTVQSYKIAKPLTVEERKGIDAANTKDFSASLESLLQRKEITREQYNALTQRAVNKKQITGKQADEIVRRGQQIYKENQEFDRQEMLVKTLFKQEKQAVEQELAALDEIRGGDLRLGVRPPSWRQIKDKILRIHPHPKLTDPEAIKAQRIFDKQRADIEAMDKKTFMDWYEGFATKGWDVGYRVKTKLLKEHGQLGKETVMRFEVAPGARAEADVVVEYWQDRIFKGLSSEDIQILGDYLQSFRTIEIDVLGLGVKPGNVKHPSNMTTDQARRFITDMRKEYGPGFERIEGAAVEFWKAMRSGLDAKLEEGLITQKGYDVLVKQLNYDPRWFIQHQDREKVYTFGPGKALSVSSSGIKKLEAGSEQSLINNPILLMQQYLSRTWGQIYNNRAVTSLYKTAQESPWLQTKDSWLQIVPRKMKTPAGYTSIYAMIDGKPKRMIMKNKYAKAWIKREPQISLQAATFMRWALGGNILRPMATGAFAPEFSIANIPRDAMLYYFVTQEYNPALPVALGQMLRNYAKTAGAVWRKDWMKGPVRDAVREGMFMDFLVYQARLPGRKKLPVGVGLAGRSFRGLRGFMEYLNLRSEVWSRMALREQAIRNGKSPQEASWIARKALDFYQGGSFVKGADNAIPYLNAGTQATRGVFRAMKNDPSGSMEKIGWIGLTATGLYMAGRKYCSDCLDAIPERIKVGNWCIPTPMYDTDKNGRKRWYYLTIPKDQAQRFIATVFEALARRQHEGKMPTGEMWQALKDGAPYVPWEHLPPNASALFAITHGVDFWRNKELWTGRKPMKPKQQFYEYTPQMFRDLSAFSAKAENFTRQKFGGEKKEVAGIAPVRLEHAARSLFTSRNIFTSLVGGSYTVMTGGMDELTKDKTTKQVISEIPGFRRYFRRTPPLQEGREEATELGAAENARQKIQNDKLREFMNQYHKKEVPLSTIRKWIRQEAKEGKRADYDRLWNQVKWMKQIYGIDIWWLNAAGLGPEERAIMVYKKWILASPAERKELEKTARTLTGFSSDRYRRMFRNLKKEAK